MNNSNAAKTKPLMGLIREVETEHNGGTMVHASSLQNSDTPQLRWQNILWAELIVVIWKEYALLHLAWKGLCLSSWKVHLNQTVFWTHYDLAPLCCIRSPDLHPTEMLWTQSQTPNVQIDLFFLSSTRALQVNCNLLSCVSYIHIETNAFIDFFYTQNICFFFPVLFI